MLSKLGERFGLHPLALEDAMNVPQRPKAERYDKHYFLVLRSLRRENDGLAEEQISVFFGEGWVVTVQENVQGDSFGSVRAAIRHGRGRTREAGADYLAYLLVDAVVDAYFPVGEALRAVARDVLAEAREALGHDKADATAVHDYRKAMKRWRALLRLLEPFLGEEGRRLRTAFPERYFCIALLVD